MKIPFLGEALGLVIGALAWVLMWTLNLGDGTLELLERNFSIRILVALAVGLITSFSVSAVLKRKRKTEE